MISVNETCVGCGACVRDCPMGILQLKDGRPSVREEKAAGCIACRHCLAVCPTDAIALRGVKASEGLSLEGLSLPTAEMAANLLVSRRSIRQYAAEEIPPARIRGLLETMKSVPTGCNIRHLAFRYVETRARMDELRRRTVRRSRASDVGSGWALSFGARPPVRESAKNGKIRGLGLSSASWEGAAGRQRAGRPAPSASPGARQARPQS